VKILEIGARYIFVAAFQWGGVHYISVISCSACVTRFDVIHHRN